MAKKKRLHQSFEEVQAILDMVEGKADIKIGTSEYWDSQSYIPPVGEIIVYTDKSSKEVGDETVYIPGLKIGSGNAYVQDLAFVDDRVSDMLSDHINDMIAHVTQAERDRWNNKLNVDDHTEVVEDELVFNRN